MEESTKKNLHPKLLLLTASVILVFGIIFQH